MTSVGIEAINVYGGTAYVNVGELAGHRKLDPARFEKLLMKEKTVALPNEDPVTFAVNAARPILACLSPEEIARIELLITCSESGIDFGKSLSTYIHQQLRLNRNCRLFEIKQACYSGTAGFQMAVNFILAQCSPGAKALVIATDISRVTTVAADCVKPNGHAFTSDWSYAEPSSGAGAVAMVIGEAPKVFITDVGANGYYGYEVMDTCRPVPDGEAGDADLSLLSYLDCCEQAFAEYKRRVSEIDYTKSFQYLVFHTPFGGMVKGAHRTMMRKASTACAEEIDRDFALRVTPGLKYCQRVGNIMGGTMFLALASTIDHGTFEGPRRVGCFSYGSGCCSEFYSGIITGKAQEQQRRLAIGQQLDGRQRLTMSEYEAVVEANRLLKFGTRNVIIDKCQFLRICPTNNGVKRLALTEIKDFHREYAWTA